MPISEKKKWILLRTPPPSNRYAHNKTGNPSNQRERQKRMGSVGLDGSHGVSEDELGISPTLNNLPRKAE